MKLTAVTLGNLDVAEVQLKRAILLFFNEQDFISALTLAGAAEEILGKLLQKKGKKHALDESIEISIRMEKMFFGTASAPKDVASVANYFRNKLKHYNEQEPLHFSADYFAAEIIDRAIDNYWELTGRETPEITKFRMEIGRLKLDAEEEQ